jgi:DNA-binding MarR family transcriptional regulator
MQHDARQRVRLAITDIMDEYGVAYEHVRKSNHPAIRFTVFGQTRTLTYSGGDPRAHLNARSQAKRLLQRLGLTPLHLSDSTKHLQTVKKGQTMSNTGASEAIAEDIVIDIENEVKSEEAKIDTPKTESPSQPEIRRFVDTGYVLFESAKYNVPQYKLSTGRFIAVRLKEELILPVGHMLVVPLDVPDVVLGMPEQDFRVFFTRAEVTEPVTQKAETVVNKANDIPKTSEPEIFDLEPEDDIDVDVESAPHFPPPSKRPRSDVNYGVSPQMGRVLLALYYLHQKGAKEIATSAIQALLSPVDAKQVSGMLSAAIKQGYVVRGSAIETGRGTYYRLLSKGRTRAQSLRTWPYDHRGLAVPPWLRESLKAN